MLLFYDYLMFLDSKETKQLSKLARAVRLMILFWRKVGFKLFIDHEGPLGRVEV